METAKEIIQKVDDKEQDEFRDLFTRQDEDFDLWNMVLPPITTEEQTIRAQTKAHGSDINVVANDLRTFSDQVQSTLASADRQIMVRMAEETGEDKREDMAKLERLFAFAFDQADLRLRRLLLPPLREALIWQGNVRGWAAVRVLVYKSGNNVIFDFMPLDPRFLIYQVGGSGMIWSGYKSYRTKAAIQDEYGKDVGPLQDKDNVVIDHWIIEKKKVWNAVACEAGFLKNPKRIKIPSIPVLVVPVSTRPPIGKSVELKGYGESIFAPARRINAIRNRFATIVANHANLMANQALINYYDSEGVADVKTTTSVPGGVVNLPMGHNKIDPSPMQEISPTVVNMLNWLNAQMEQATLPKIPIGTPAPSGTLYNLAQEAGNKVFNPQVRNLNYLYSDMCHLIEEQLIGGRLKVEIKGMEKDKYYETEVTPIDLKKPHTINVEFTAKTPWSQLDTYQVADMAKRQGLPQSFINEYILKLPDPKGLSDQLAIEMAEHSPKLAMVKAIQALLTYGRVDEAQQLMKDLYSMEMSEQMEMAGEGQQIEGTERELEEPRPPEVTE